MRIHYSVKVAIKGIFPWLFFSERIILIGSSLKELLNYYAVLFANHKQKCAMNLHLSQASSVRLTIFIDGWCPSCRRFSRLVHKCDLFHRIAIRDVRQMKNGEVQNLDVSMAIRQLASVNQRGRVCYGYDSILNIVRYIPLGWIFLPFFLLLKIGGLGGYLYRELAIRRRIIPIGCNDSCTLE